LIDYARDTAAKAVEEQAAKLAPALKILTDRNDLLTAEVKRLREEQERLKKDNSIISQENIAFKDEAKKMRDLPLDVVLTKMFGATESRYSQGQVKRYDLPDGAFILFTDNQWQEPFQGCQGKGAVNLVMHLSGYGQGQYQQAVRDMAGVFSDRETVTSLNHYMAETLNQKFRGMKQGQYQKPPASDTHWSAVREYLVEEMQLPATLIDQAHDDGLIYSDHRKNCVFLRDQDSGAFIINTKGKPFARSLGHNSGPYVLPGSDNIVYLTDTPMEALSLKAINPDSTVLATGGFFHKDNLKPHLEGKAKIILARGRDEKDEEYARYLAQNYPQAERHLPKRGQSWNEEWRLQREERERAKLLSMESTRPKATPVEMADEVLKPAAGMWR
jgi:hypothetical protein